jgi:hypothetical protein
MCGAGYRGGTRAKRVARPRLSTSRYSTCPAGPRGAARETSCCAQSARWSRSGHRRGPAAGRGDQHPIARHCQFGLSPGRRRTAPPTRRPSAARAEGRQSPGVGSCCSGRASGAPRWCAYDVGRPAARAFGVSARTVWRWVQRYRQRLSVPCSGIGRSGMSGNSIPTGSSSRFKKSALREVGGLFRLGVS